jgi:hypothetical protein
VKDTLLFLRFIDFCDEYAPLKTLITTETGGRVMAAPHLLHLSNRAGGLE